MKHDETTGVDGRPFERDVGRLVPKRRTLAEMAAVLRAANPKNTPMYLRWMAAQWWPDAYWLHKSLHNQNGGAKCGPRVAGAFAGRLERAGLLRMCADDGPRCYLWREPPNAGDERAGRSPV